VTPSIDRPLASFTADDGVRLAYQVDDWTDPWRTPQTLVLLHAAMGSSRRLYAWVPHLSRHVRLVRPDLRGHGGSAVPAPDRPFTLERLARDVIDLLDHLGLDRVHLAGSSAGAIISMKVAIDHPDRIRSLGIFASTPGLKPSNVNTARWVAQIRDKGLRGFLADTIGDRFDLARVDPGFVEWFLDESARTSADWLARFVPLMGGVDLSDEIGRIRCPTLAVVPDHDPISSMAQYEVLRQRIPDIEFVVYQGLPHNITDAVPDRCAEELRRFLSTHQT
jgi:pimeloyl-ACP methyl ester carboxylesterase